MKNKIEGRVNKEREREREMIRQLVEWKRESGRGEGVVKRKTVTQTARTIKEQERRTNERLG